MMKKQLVWAMLLALVSTSVPSPDLGRRRGRERRGRSALRPRADREERLPGPARRLPQPGARRAALPALRAPQPCDPRAGAVRARDALDRPGVLDGNRPGADPERADLERPAAAGERPHHLGRHPSDQPRHRLRRDRPGRRLSLDERRRALDAASSTARCRWRSAPWRSRPPIPRSSTSAPASRAARPTASSASGSTASTTPARRANLTGPINPLVTTGLGNIEAFTGRASARSSCTRRTRRRSSSPPRPAPAPTPRTAPFALTVPPLGMLGVYRSTNATVGVAELHQADGGDGRDGPAGHDRQHRHHRPGDGPAEREPGRGLGERNGRRERRRHLPLDERARTRHRPSRRRWSPPPRASAASWRATTSAAP